MYELRFSASQHHIPPVPLGHSTLINPAAAEKVMQEPLFGAFLHHFSPIPRKRPELEVRRTRSRACTQVHERIESGRTASGPRSDEKRCTKGRGAPSCISSSHHTSKGERIDDECFLCSFSSSILILSEITDYFFFR